MFILWTMLKAASMADSKMLDKKEKQEKSECYLAKMWQMLYNRYEVEGIVWKKSI